MRAERRSAADTKRRDRPELDRASDSLHWAQAGTPIWNPLVWCCYEPLVSAEAGLARAGPATPLPDACSRVIREYSEISGSNRNRNSSRVQEVWAAKSA